MVEKDFVAYRSNNNDENGEENWRESPIKSIVERTSSSGEKGIRDDYRRHADPEPNYIEDGGKNGGTGFSRWCSGSRRRRRRRGARGHPLGVFSPPIPRAEER